MVKRKLTKGAPKTKRPSIADRALIGIKEAGAYARGEAIPGAVVHKPVDVAAVRAKVELTQPAFAERYGFAVGTLRDWEQGRTNPDRMARTLLRAISLNPKLIEEAAREEAA